VEGGLSPAEAEAVQEAPPPVEEVEDIALGNGGEALMVEDDVDVVAVWAPEVASGGEDGGAELPRVVDEGEPMEPDDGELLPQALPSTA